MAKTTYSPWFTWTLGIVIVGAYFFAHASDPAPAAPQKAAAPPSAPSQATLKADAEMRAAIAAAKAIKAGTKNPASFQLDIFLIYPGGVTCYEYRGTNSFNALVPAQAVFNPAGPSILTSDRDGNKLVKAWNTLCTQHGGRELHQGVHAMTDL